ncbi:Glomulin [Habropoda laboriosa]|uniref:Glomulin n=1 Tax=Habropoda laboriosa TaxID=597456 RepID=A0A0L7QX10_9HYME|nr:PREDICTED: glomulin [Habropoda laboriosa]KOC63152.1 Glomulin [Habropoda laboriosa]
MSEFQENLTKKFINKLTDCLKENKFEEALNLFEGSNYDNIIKESSWDIVPIVSSHLTTENVKCNEDLIVCCTTILNAIIEKCSPSETVLELLEQVEGPEDDIKFCVILSVLSKCLSKLNDKVKAIEWCISTIRSYIDSLPVPVNESESNTDTINKIKNVYNAVMLFLDPLVDEASLKKSQNCVTLRDYLASILIFLMGRPLCYLQEKQLQSHLEEPLPAKIVTLESQVTADMLWPLNIARIRNKKTKFKKRNVEEKCSNLKVILFELNENIPDLAYANFYFYVITKPHLWEKVPQVYDSQYIFQECIYLVIKLLQEQKCVIKGINFMDHLLKKVTRRTLTSQFLELDIYLELFDALVKVMVYCDSDKERKKALNVFQEYIEMFNMQARYFIILHLYQTSEHSGLLSLTTGIFKASIIECLEATPPIPYFLGNNLESLIKLACKLPHGSASDLVELSDEVITSLNLLRFLLIRDKHNQTGIWNLMDKLQNDFLKPLREGIDICRVHWRVKIKDLEEQKKMHKISEDIELEKSDAEVTLTVGGEKLPAMPVPEKISFCYQAVNGLDLMESILIRVNECIANNPLEQ